MISRSSTFASVVNLRIPGLRLRDFALHRPQTDRSVMRAHSRNWSRAVFFLDGPAALPGAIEGQFSAGTVLMLPPGQSHSVAAHSGPLPPCLVFDFRLGAPAPRTVTTCTVQRAELLRAREQVAYLLRFQADAGGQAECETAMIVLTMLVALLRSAGWLTQSTDTAPAGGDSAMHRLLLTMSLESPLQQVVDRSGYQRDHLNRLVKRETGLTLGQFRMQRRLSRAKELLQRGVKVGDVAGEIGLPDQSYFARWFRRQTGMAPSQWLQTGGLKAPFGLALCG